MVEGIRLQVRSTGNFCAADSLTPNEYGYIRVVYDHNDFTVYLPARIIWREMVKVPDRPSEVEEEL